VALLQLVRYRADVQFHVGSETYMIHSKL
jgi:hypothetical protein